MECWRLVTGPVWSVSVTTLSSLERSDVPMRKAQDGAVSLRSPPQRECSTGLPAPPDNITLFPSLSPVRQSPDTSDREPDIITAQHEVTDCFPEDGITL